MTDNACARCAELAANKVLEGSDRLYGTTTERFDVVRCGKCGMLRLSPRPEGEILAGYYPAGYWFDPRESRSAWIAGRYRRLVLLDHIGFIRAQGRVLDVGSGGGLLAGMLRERGVQAVGFDASPQACAIAWHRHGVPCVAGDLTEGSPFLAASFDAVMMFHVLEHVPDPRRFLSVARDLLVPAGRMIVQVPNAGSWQFRWLQAKWNGLDIPRHLHHFRAADLAFLLEETGFEILRTKHFSWRDNPAGLATSLAPSLDPMARVVRGKRSGVLTLGAYFALAMACVPFAALEALFGQGSTVMMEARKR